MVGLFQGNIGDFEAVSGSLKPHRLKAAAAPHLSIKELAKEASSPQSGGNFQDLEGLLEQLGEAPVFELGSPVPQDRFLPKPRVGDCPASHNRALLDEAAD